MLITLPPRKGSAPLSIDTQGLRHIVIIGANGAGKTRFAKRLRDSLGHQAFAMSALKAIYGRDREDTTGGSVDWHYRQAVEGASLLRSDLKGEFERIIGLLVNEEMLSLIAGKYTAASSTTHPCAAHTRLEHVINRWKSVFPDNKVMVEGGKMLFGSLDSDDKYSPAKLSDGEKAVLYYLGAAAYAPAQAVVLVDSPGMFMHPSSTASLWNAIEDSRPDCTFIYVTHDLQFASTRGEGCTVWVKGCDYARGEWDYDLLTPAAGGIGDEVYMAILGARKPVLFIEGDALHSIDARLYPLIFNDHTVKPLGGCDRVIEATRTFNALRSFHNLNAFGIVDRDRREQFEVEYLRRKQVYVPDVAEVENIFMLEPVVRSLARINRRDPDRAFAKVKQNIMRLFEADLKAQALQHTRHRVKKALEHNIDRRFATIGQLEQHISQLAADINPAAIYDGLCREFNRYLSQDDYKAILRVYNRKTMLSESHVARHCGLKRDDKDTYINTLLYILAHNKPGADEIRTAIRGTFRLEK